MLLRRLIGVRALREGGSPGPLIERFGWFATIGDENTIAFAPPCAGLAGGRLFAACGLKGGSQREGHATLSAVGKRLTEPDRTAPRVV